LPVINLAYQKFRDRAEAVTRLMMFAKSLLTMDAQGMNEAQAIRESGVITVERPTKLALYDDSPPDGSPIRETKRHIAFTE
jgi:hypothetical protein